MNGLWSGGKNSIGLGDTMDHSLSPSLETLNQDDSIEISLHFKLQQKSNKRFVPQ